MILECNTSLISIKKNASPIKQLGWNLHARTTHWQISVNKLFLITKLLQQPLLTWKEIIILVDYLMWQLQYHLCRSAWRWYVALVGGLEVFHFHHHNVHGKIHCSFTRYFFFSEILNIDEGWYIPTKELYILYMYINTKGILYWKC